MSASADTNSATKVTPAVSLLNTSTIVGSTSAHATATAPTKTASFTAGDP